MLQLQNIAGALVSFPARGLKRPLDGFWSPSRRRSDTLLLIVHGMGSNFYRSPFKKALMIGAARAGLDTLSFNNRGFEQNTADEVFEECRHDLDAALAFGRARGYRRFVLLGHSTGCQKIAYYQYRRKAADIAALIFAAPGDDYAIARRELGTRFGYWVRRAHTLVRAGRGHELLPGKGGFMAFSARRFLSLADLARVEARLFHMDGPMRELASIRTPILLVLPAREEYACIPVPEMARRVKAVARARPFDVEIIPRADHGFKGAEAETARRLFAWIKQVGRLR